jgi:hypothetical protein
MPPSSQPWRAPAEPSWQATRHEFLRWLLCVVDRLMRQLLHELRYRLLGISHGRRKTVSLLLRRLRPKVMYATQSNTP